MRAFRISLALIVAMLVLIGCCTVFGRRTCEQMQQMIVALPDSPEQNTQAQALEARQYWDRYVRGLRATVNRTMVRNIGDLINDVVVYSDIRLGGEPDYRSARTRLLGALDEMHRSTKATFGLWS